MKIAYIVLKGMPLGGGIEKYTEEIGSRLAGRGHTIIVYTMKHYGAKEGLFKGMLVKPIPTIMTKSLEKISASLIATLYNALDRNFDIIHFHAFGPSLFCFIPMLIGRKVVVQGHGIEWRRSRWGIFGRTFLRLSEIPSIKLPHVVTVVSKVQKRYILENYGRESVFIPTGVNPPVIERPELINQLGLRGNDYILFVGRLVREKGVHHLIAAYNRLNPRLKLVIAGNALHEDSYKSYLNDLTARNSNIIFTGFVTGKMLNELYSNCYMFILPSEVEGLSTSLLEAMSYGNCCLVSDIQENLEAMNDHGYAFINRDRKDLANKIDHLINNVYDVEKVKSAARSYALDKHSWDLIAYQFEQLYTTLVGNVSEV